jgi:hypothetical protein
VDTKTETMENQIKLLQENIKRLESTILMAYTFQKGYIENCKKTIESYKEQIEILEARKFAKFLINN